VFQILISVEGHGNTDGHEYRGERSARRPARRSGKRGRPPTASPDDVLALVTELYLDGQRVDVTVVAARLGLGRATIYRWFGSREALLGEVIARQLELLVARKRAEVRRRGAAGLLEVLDRVNRTLTRSRAVRGLLESERTAMRIFTSSAGVVEPRAVACIQALIEEEMAAGDYEPPADPATLAYALVHLRHAFLWNDATNGVRGDYERLHDVSAALLGIPRKRGPTVARRTRRV
jgi:AcrR family transcriptional regulator